MSDVKLFRVTSGSLDALPGQQQGRGDAELRIYSLDDLPKAKPLIQKSLEEN